MIVEMAATVIAPLMGYLVKRQLDINRQVELSKEAVENLEKDVTYTRDRVDKIYDHLLNR
jgi:hypothetical protein